MGTVLLIHVFSMFAPGPFLVVAGPMHIYASGMPQALVRFLLWLQDKYMPLA